jgi:hypothetical protein
LKCQFLERRREKEEEREKRKRNEDNVSPAKCASMQDRKKSTVEIFKHHQNVGYTKFQLKIFTEVVLISY